MVTEWIITEIDGKIASIAADYRHFAEIAAKVAQLPPTSVDVITTQKVSTDELIAMAGTLTWEDFRLFGTKFQLGVWKTLFENTPTQDLLINAVGSICREILKIKATLFQTH